MGVIYERYTGGSRLEVSDEFADELIESQRFLMAIWKVEDLFKILFDAFVELERHSINESIDSLYFAREKMEAEDWFDVSNRYIAKLLAFVAAARVHDEQTRNILHEVGLDSKSIRQAFSGAFDARLEYKLMYALRNCLMHNNTDIVGVMLCHSNQWRDGPASTQSPSRHRSTFEPFLKADKFLACPKVNSLTREVLSSIEEKQICLRYLTRGYIESLHAVQVELRGLTEGRMNECILQLQQARELFESNLERECKYLHVKKDETEAYIDTEHYSRVTDLRLRSQGAAKAHHLFVSSELTQRPERFPRQNEKVWIVK